MWRQQPDKGGASHYPLSRPYCIVLDPVNPGQYYLSSHREVVQFDSSGVVTPIAGSAQMGGRGFADGCGADARFSNVRCILYARSDVGAGGAAATDTATSTDIATAPAAGTVSVSGPVLFGIDSGGDRVRRIEITTREVTTVAGQSRRALRDGTGLSAMFYHPRMAVWDTSDKSPPDTVMYITEAKHVRMFNVKHAV